MDLIVVFSFPCLHFVKESVITFVFYIPEPKKRRNRAAQDDFEMIDSGANVKNTDNLSPMDSTETQPSKLRIRFSETPEEIDDHLLLSGNCKIMACIIVLHLRFILLL